MTVEDRAEEFVKRTSAALGDLETAEEIRNNSVRSATEEMKLHSLPLDLDKAIRKVAGGFKQWRALEPAEIEGVRDGGPINLLWVISAHPSGRVREAVVHATKDFDDDRILPHLANRSIDFVPDIRALVGPLITARLERVLATQVAADPGEVLPTSAHIAVTKLLEPRTAMVSPELMQVCIDLAHAANMPLSRRLRGGGMHRMLDRCQQTLDAAEEAASRAALTALMGFFTERAAAAQRSAD